MARDRQPDERISKWLEAEAPGQMPDRVLRATFERTRSSRQNLGWRALLWRMHLNRFVFQLGGAVVVVAAALALGLSVNNPRAGIGTRASMVPSATPTGAALPSVEATAGPSPEPRVTELLNSFIQTRIAGEGAQQYLAVPEAEVPLLYATTSGAPYERGEFEQMRPIEWPRGSQAFEVRLFGGDSVVEQLFFFTPEPRPMGLGYLRGAFGSDLAPTTEDGQPVAQAWNAFDGEVTLQVAHPWVGWRWEDDPYLEEQWGIHLLPDGPVPPRVDPELSSASIILKADPVLGGADCQTGPGYADAAELAFHIGHYPGVEATAPVAVSAGTTTGVMFDVVIAARTPITVPVDGEGRVCDPQILGLLIDTGASAFVHDGVLTTAASGERMRLYLFDVPEGLSMRTLAFAITASKSDFERAVEAAAPVADTIQFHAP